MIEQAKICSHETEVYSRVAGYYRPVKQWNPGKQEEFGLRVVFEIGQFRAETDLGEENGKNKAHDTGEEK